jgi:hypothetical protein
VEGLGEGFDGEGFGEAWDAFEQDVAVGEQADDETFDEVALADDDLVDLGEKGADERGGALDFLVDGGDAGAHAGSLMPKGQKGAASPFGDRSLDSHQVGLGGGCMNSEISL